MTASKIYSRQFSNNSLINDLVVNHNNGLLAYTDSNITYNFQKPTYIINEDGIHSKTVAWTSAEKARLEDTLDAFRLVSQLTFQKLDSDSSLLVDLDIRKADIAYDRTAGWSDGAFAYAFFPNESPLSPANDVVFRNDSYNNTASNIADGSPNFNAQLHEIGHALGLDHPHDGGVDGASSASSPGNHGLNDSRYTVMSYGQTSDYFPSSLMALDIAAIQYLYGTDMNTATGNDIYDLNNVINKSYKTIWDAGGSDTLQYNGSANIVIDLRAAHLNENATAIEGQGNIAHNYNGAAGYFSGLYDGAQYDDRGLELLGGYYIASGVVIENAQSGKGDDRLIGNSASNYLDGGAGSDSLTGGDGSDVYIYTLGDGSDIINDYATDNSVDQLFFDFSLSVSAPTLSWKDNDNLYMDFGSGENITVTDWRLGDDYQIEEFVFNDLSISADLFLIYFGGLYA